MIIPGEGKAWEQLLRRSATDIARCSLASVDEPSGVFHLASLGTVLMINPLLRTVEASDAGLMKQIGHFWRLTTLWYLASAQDLPLTARLAAPHEMKSGFAFFRGSHSLPLQRLADRFTEIPEEFHRAAVRLGGEAQEFGDAAVRIPVFPRTPVTLILWHADEEFPARSQLLFDASATHHLPIDAVWSAAMMTLQAMMII